jgi:hypothetical protein
MSSQFLENSRVFGVDVARSREQTRESFVERSETAEGTT